MRETLLYINEADVMKGEPNLSNILDVLIEIIGKNEGYESWAPASTQPCVVEFDEPFGAMPMNGTPDALFQGLPVELKTMVNSGLEGAKKKILEYLLQCGTYQNTHSVDADTITPAILMVVSLHDREILALEVTTENFDEVLRTWNSNLVKAIGDENGPLFKYWQEFKAFSFLDEEAQMAQLPSRMVNAKTWLLQDAYDSLNTALALLAAGAMFADHSEFVAAVSDSLKFIYGYLGQTGKKGKASKNRTVLEFKNALAGNIRPYFDHFMDAGVQAFQAGYHQMAKEKFTVASLICEKWAHHLCTDSMRSIVQYRIDEAQAAKVQTQLAAKAQARQGGLRNPRASNSEMKGNRRKGNRRPGGHEVSRHSGLEASIDGPA